MASGLLPNEVLRRSMGSTVSSRSAVQHCCCLAAAALSAVAHLALEQTAWPQSVVGCAACIALGLGPVGLAFYLWDIGMKRGDIQLLGVASYAAPLISTAVLIGAGFASPTWQTVLASILITGGALIAARRIKAR